MITLLLYLMLVLLVVWLLFAIIGKILGMPVKGIKSFVTWIVELVRDK